MHKTIDEINKIVRSITGRLNCNIDSNLLTEDDLLSIGYIGYYKAVKSFDESLGDFGNLVYTCILNEMHSYLREIDFISYSYRKKVREGVSNYSRLNVEDIDHVVYINYNNDIENITKKYEDVINGLDNINSNEKFVIIQSILYNKKINEISKKLNKTENAISCIKLRALRKLNNPKVKQAIEGVSLYE